MTKYSKYNFVYRLQKWLDSVPGQTTLGLPLGGRPARYILFYNGEFDPGSG